jgi:hypothetical protein
MQHFILGETKKKEKLRINYASPPDKSIGRLARPLNAQAKKPSPVSGRWLSAYKHVSKTQPANRSAKGKSPTSQVAWHHLRALPGSRSGSRPPDDTGIIDSPLHARSASHSVQQTSPLQTLVTVSSMSYSPAFPIKTSPS